METLQNLFRIVHVTAGFVGLAAFWVPVFTRKGSQVHKRFGRVFKWSAYIVLAFAAGIIVVETAQAVLNGVGPRQSPSGFAFLVFLGYLTLVTFVVLRHGVGVLNHKGDLTEMNRPLDRFLARANITASIGVIAYALYFSPPNAILLYALSPIGILSGRGILKAVNGRLTDRYPWLSEHIGGLLGAGIAFHTAFFVFGSAQLFRIDLPGAWQVVPWILPAVVGIPASFLWARKYNDRLPAAARDTTP